MVLYCFISGYECSRMIHVTYSGISMAILICGLGCRVSFCVWWLYLVSVLIYYFVSLSLLLLPHLWMNCFMEIAFIMRILIKLFWDRLFYWHFILTFCFFFIWWKSRKFYVWSAFGTSNVPCLTNVLILISVYPFATDAPYVFVFLLTQNTEIIFPPSLKFEHL